jgi:hypothetical protein
MALAIRLKFCGNGICTVNNVCAEPVPALAQLCKTYDEDKINSPLNQCPQNGNKNPYTDMHMLFRVIFFKFKNQ